MASHSEIAARWVAVVQGDESRIIGGTAGNVFATETAIYSYGRHFPLAVPLRSRDGSLIAFLLNGDRYSVTTMRHQSIMRDAVGGARVPYIIVPFSAIDSAGIVRDTIRPVDIRPDRMEPETWRCSRAHTEYVNRGDGTGHYDHVECDGMGHVHTRHVHHLGDSVFLASVRSHDALQTITRTDVRFLSSFDFQEPRDLYFLAELPAHSHADTVQDAFADLRPVLVRKADDAGRGVTRQGDMFAVEPEYPMSRGMLRTAGAVFGKRTSLYGTAHTATETATMPDGIVWARGTFRHEPRIIGESWRERDHIMRRIGDGKAWHRVTPNTVPRGTNGTIGARVVAAPRAWTIAGRVD